MPAPIFDKKLEVEREEFREALRKKIKGVRTPKMSFQEKTQMERKIFGGTFVKKISQEDYRKALRKIDRTKFGAVTMEDRSKIEGRVRYFKRLGGLKSLKPKR